MSISGLLAIQFATIYYIIFNAGLIFMANDIFKKLHEELDDCTKDLIYQVKCKAEQLLSLYEDVGPGRETSLAITNLEQSVMWAVKSCCLERNVKEN